MSRVVALGVLLLASGCHADDAPAVLAQTPSGSALRWTQPDIVLTPAAEVAGAEPSPTLRDALVRAVQRWNRALAGCAAPRLRANRQTLDAPLVRDDVVNAVLLHERRWCPPGVVEPEDCYPSDLTGRTHLYPRLVPGDKRDGELSGVDVELNGVNGGRDAHSLEASLVHELGHVLGLDHPCGPNGAWQRAQRKLVPCEGEAVERQVMHPTWAARVRGDDLSPSGAEVSAVCAVYASRP